MKIDFQTLQAKTAGMQKQAKGGSRQKLVARTRAVEQGKPVPTNREFKRDVKPTMPKADVSGGSRQDFVKTTPEMRQVVDAHAGIKELAASPKLRAKNPEVLDLLKTGSPAAGIRQPTASPPVAQLATRADIVRNRLRKGFGAALNFGQAAWRHPLNKLVTPIAGTFGALEADKLLGDYSPVDWAARKLEGLFGGGSTPPTKAAECPSFMTGRHKTAAGARPTRIARLQKPSASAADIKRRAAEVARLRGNPNYGPQRAGRPDIAHDAQIADLHARQRASGATTAGNIAAALGKAPPVQYVSPAALARRRMEQAAATRGIIPHAGAISPLPQNRTLASSSNGRVRVSEPDVTVGGLPSFLQPTGIASSAGQRRGVGNTQPTPMAKPTSNATNKLPEPIIDAELVSSPNSVATPSSTTSNAASSPTTPVKATPVSAPGWRVSEQSGSTMPVKLLSADPTPVKATPNPAPAPNPMPTPTPMPKPAPATNPTPTPTPTPKPSPNPAPVPPPVITPPGGGSGGRGSGGGGVTPPATPPATPRQGMSGLTGMLLGSGLAGGIAATPAALSGAGEGLNYLNENYNPWSGVYQARQFDKFRQKLRESGELRSSTDATPPAAPAAPAAPATPFGQGMPAWLAPGPDGLWTQEQRDKARAWKEQKMEMDSLIAEAYGRNGGDRRPALRNMNQYFQSPPRMAPTAPPAMPPAGS